MSVHVIETPQLRGMDLIRYCHEMIAFHKSEFGYDTGLEYWKQRLARMVKRNHPKTGKCNNPGCRKCYPVYPQVTALEPRHAKEGLLV